MGLAITVGIAADLQVNDQEGLEWVQEEVDAVNRELARQGLPQHEEPLDCAVWSEAAYGYSGLHVLGEVAGLTWAG